MDQLSKLQNGTDPLISVLIAIKDEEKYISESLDSVINQDYPNIEIIVVDDGSTDSTNKLVSEILLLDKRITLLTNSTPGKVSAFNLAYSHSDGQYVCFFAGDDIMTRTSISSRLRAMQNSDEENLASVSKFEILSSDPRINQKVLPKKKGMGSYSGGTMLLKRKLAEEIFPIPGELINEDMWCWLHLLQNESKVTHDDNVVAKYRIHENNSSPKTSNFVIKNQAITARYIVYEVFLNRFRSKLSKTDIQKYSNLAAAEKLRLNGAWVKLLFMKNLPITKKIWFVVHSNKLFYWVSVRLRGVV